VEKWKKQEKEEQRKKRNKGGVDARFIGAEHYIAPHLAEGHIDIKSLKSFLEKSLVLPSKKI